MWEQKSLLRNIDEKKGRFKRQKLSQISENLKTEVKSRGGLVFQFLVGNLYGNP